MANRQPAVPEAPPPRGLGEFLRGPLQSFDDDEWAKHAPSIEQGGFDDVTWEMIKASPAYLAQEVLTGAPEWPYNGKFLLGDHHLEWDRLVTADKDDVTKDQRLCVLAPRDHGKCQRGDALILTPSGRRVRIDEWEGGELWAYNPSTHEFEAAFAPASRPNGVKRVLRVTTRSGRRVVVTENHPLRMWDSWVRADELQVGQRIGVPYKSPSNATGTMPDAWVVGLLVGDGGLTGSNVVLSTGDPEVLRQVRSEYTVRHAANSDYRILGMQPRMRELGLMGETSHTKRVPQEVMLANNLCVAEFIAGYLDADATVNRYGGGAVEFYSVSEGLLLDVQHLLTRLGILAALTPKRGRYRGAAHHSWRLTIRGRDLITLAAKVHPRGGRREALAALVRTQESKAVTSGACLDRFPCEVWGLLTRPEDWFRRNGHTRPSKQYAPTRSKLLRVAEAEGNEQLKALAQAPILWDEVVCVEDLGEDETWSIHVPGLENYLADDVINHNTFFFDYAVPIWKAVTMPNCVGYIFSATAPQAVRILDDIKGEIEGNPKLQYLIPAKKSRWGSTMIRLTNGHTIYARGFGTRVRGAHPHWIIVDDALNDDHMYSSTVRDKAKDYFYSAITNMCVPGGQIIVVGTPFHIEDLYGDLEENPEYVFRRYQARKADGSALWPERYNDKRLTAKLAEIQSVRFTREFMCEPISDDMSLFPSYLFTGEPTEQPTIRLGEAKEFWDALDVTIYMAADFALSSNVGADYTVIWVMGIDPLGNRWIIDIVRGKGLPYQAQLSKINELGKLYDPALIYLEANQMQAIFGQELIRTTDLPIKPFVTTAHNKNALDKGVPSLRVLLENGKFRIPRGDARSVSMTNEWIKEMRSFTWHEGKLQSVSGHDDMVMACWIADMAIKDGGFSFEFGADETDPENLDEMLTLANREEIDHEDMAVLDNRDPDILDDTIRAIHGIAARVVGARTPGGVQRTKDGHLLIRVLHGDPKYLRFVLENQGYADFVRMEVPVDTVAAIPGTTPKTQITAEDADAALDEATEALITGVSLIDEDSYTPPLLGRSGVWY